MTDQHLFIPSFRERTTIIRTVMFLLLVSFFLAAFEVGLTQKLMLSQLPLQLYLHCFFLLNSAAILIGSFEFLRKYIDPLPSQQAWLCVLALTIAALCVSTLWVNVIHEVTGVQSWSNQKLTTQLIFHSLLGLVLVGVAVHYFDLQQRSMKQYSADLQSQVYNLESRMQPHFFFNAMNSLLYLVESKDDKAAGLVEDMAAFFRVSLRKPHMVSVKQEIDTCERYLKIEQLRLGEQFQVTWDIPNSNDLYLPQLPSLSLQPIFEYILTEGTQYQPMNILVNARVMQESTNEIFEMFWHVPLIENKEYIAGLQAVLDNMKRQLYGRFGDKVKLFLHANKQNHTIGLIYPINSVI